MALQILRGTENLNPTTTDNHILQDGQLFYSKFNNQTYIGEDEKPISQLKPKISSWLEPGEGNGAIQSSHKYLAEDYHGEAYSNEAKGSGSLALGGYGNKAFGTRSVALQNQSKSLANTSFVIGQVNTAYEDASGTFIGGNGNVGYIPYSFIFGTKNTLALSTNFAVTDCSANLISGDLNKLYDADTSSIHGYGNLSGRLSILDVGVKAANHILGAHNISYGTSIYTVGNYNKASGWYLDQVGQNNFAVSASDNYFYNSSTGTNKQPHISDFAKNEDGQYKSTSDNTPLYYTHQFGNNLIVGRWHTTQIGEYNHTNMYNAIEFGVNVSESLDAPTTNPIRSTPLSITRRGKALYGVPYQAYCDRGEDVFELDITSTAFDGYELATHDYVDQKAYALDNRLSELQTSIDTNIDDVRGELNDLTSYVDNKDAQTLTGAQNYTDDKLSKLYLSKNSDVSQTITYIGQNNGIITATINPIQINESQVTDLQQHLGQLNSRCDDLGTAISTTASDLNSEIESVRLGIPYISYDAENGILTIG